jgi:hypothetical protein
MRGIIGWSQGISLELGIAINRGVIRRRHANFLGGRRRLEQVSHGDIFILGFHDWVRAAELEQGERIVRQN